jgi:hypothetical protein
MVVIYAVLLLDRCKDIPIKIINQPQTRNFLGLLTTRLEVDTILVSLTDWGKMSDYLMYAVASLLFLVFGFTIKNWKDK